MVTCPGGVGDDKGCSGPPAAKPTGVAWNFGGMI